MYCQKCGSANPEEARFCRECGNAFFAPEVNDKNVGPQAITIPVAPQPRIERLTPEPPPSAQDPNVVYHGRTSDCFSQGGTILAAFFLTPMFVALMASAMALARSTSVHTMLTEIQFGAAVGGILGIAFGIGLAIAIYRDWHRFQLPLSFASVKATLLGWKASNEALNVTELAPDKVEFTTSDGAGILISEKNRAILIGDKGIVKKHILKIIADTVFVSKAFTD